MFDPDLERILGAEYAESFLQTQQAYVSRSSQRVAFDDFVLSEMEKSKKSKVAIRKALKKRPELAALVGNESEADTRLYFDRLLQFVTLARYVEDMKRNHTEISRLERELVLLKSGLDLRT